MITVLPVARWSMTEPAGIMAFALVSSVRVLPSSLIQEVDSLDPSGNIVLMIRSPAIARNGEVASLVDTGRASVWMVKCRSANAGVAAAARRANTTRDALR